MPHVGVAYGRMHRRHQCHQRHQRKWSMVLYLGDRSLSSSLQYYNSHAWHPYSSQNMAKTVEEHVRFESPPSCCINSTSQGSITKAS